MQNHSEALLARLTPRMTKWEPAKIRTSRIMRFAEAYLMLAKQGYRPQAPGDGFGSINLSDEQLDDKNRLYDEAIEYAMKLYKQDEEQTFTLHGCTNWNSNRAFVLALEAANLLMSGMGNEQVAVGLLEAAAREVKAERKVAAQVHAAE